MRTSTLYILIIATLSCGQKQNRQDTGELLTSNKNEPTSEILGEWGIYVVDNAYCNACPTIAFKINGTATITFPNGTTEIVGWKEGKNKMTIKNYSTNGDAGEFADGEYLIALEKVDKSTVLKLTKETTSYILRR
jgi:hypothetical protein